MCGPSALFLLQMFRNADARNRDFQQRYFGNMDQDVYNIDLVEANAQVPRKGCRC